MNKLKLTAEDLEEFKSLHSIILPKRVRDYEHYMILDNSNSNSKNRF